MIAELLNFQGMQALLDLISTLDGSVSDTAKLLGYVCYSCVILCFFLLCFQHDIAFTVKCREWECFNYVRRLGFYQEIETTDVWML